MGAFARFCAAVLRGLGGVAGSVQANARHILPIAVLALLIGAAAPVMAQPVVTLQPRDVTTNLGADAFFSVRAYGADGVTWQRKGATDTDFVDMAPSSPAWSVYGASNLMLFFTDDSDDGAHYRAAVFGPGGTVYSTPAILTLYVPISVTSLAPSVVPLAGGASVVITGQGFSSASKV